MNGAIPAQVAMASVVASLSSPSAMGVQWSNGVSYGAVISNREVAGSIPDDYGHTRISSLSQTPPDFSFILLGGY